MNELGVEVVRKSCKRNTDTLLVDERAIDEINIFSSQKSLKAYGFEGFLSVPDLRASGFSGVPRDAGVYLALWPRPGRPTILKRGPVKSYKGRTGYYDASRLEKEWVDGALAVYIGMTAARTGLHGRIRSYLNWPKGKLGHSGGKAVWQIDGNDDLLFCWKHGHSINGKTPYEAETSLIKLFSDIYGQVPFANMDKKGVV
jgi:hypothetical protein